MSLGGTRKNIHQLWDYTICMNTKLESHSSFNYHSSLQVRDKVSHLYTTGRVITVKYEDEWSYTQWQSRESSVYVQITHYRNFDFHRHDACGAELLPVRTLYKTAYHKTDAHSTGYWLCTMWDTTDWDGEESEQRLGRNATAVQAQSTHTKQHCLTKLKHISMQWHSQNFLRKVIIRTPSCIAHRIS